MTTPPLATSVSTLTSSLHLLTTTISTLSAATADFPRMTKVLSVNRHFELLSEPEIHAAQASLREEIVPEFQHLLRKVEVHLERMERREKGLVAKSELLKGRIEAGLAAGKAGSAGASGEPAGGRAASSAFGGGGGGAAIGGASARENAERMRQLRAKKERLMYTVERLSLQKGQKHRQLRMSMSYKGVIP
ncbi:DASH complex subunit Spc19 [Kalaharituber pfeilii]|nr:DASH complex subunit Spc19 [Kalaharituber pfeilii]